jgi:nucleotide-binding universal stress UspA family protein
MTWKPIVVGVDTSPESAWAAAVAAEIAKAAGTKCQLVHAARDVLSALALAEVPERAQEFSDSLVAQTREAVLHGLWGVVPTELAQELSVRRGRAPAVLKQVAAQMGAELVVLGGKHHSLLGRWFAGSTSVDVVRTTELPVLVTGGQRTSIRRVLATVDQSAAARPTIEAAERFAALFGAKVRVLSVLEPLPIVPEAPNYDLGSYYAMLEEHLKRDVWPLIKAPETEKTIRYGMPVETIMQEAAEWHADVLVIGSHGKGWVDRLLIGSVTERLLNQLPASLLVVPVYAYVEAREPSTARAAQAAYA